MLSHFDWRLREGHRGLRFALLAAQLALVWGFHYFPTQDGRAHLYNSEIFRLYHQPAMELARRFFALNILPVPNWFDHLAMAGLLSLFSPVIAEKILASGYLILLPASAAYALKRVRPGSEFAAFVVLALSVNIFFCMGFYNFIYGMVAFFYLLGYWAAHRGKFGAQNGVVLGLLGLACYFCHLFTFVVAMMFLAILGLCHGIREVLPREVNATPSWRHLLLRLWRAFRTQALGPLLALAPGIALTVWFMLRESGGPEDELPPPWRERIAPLRFFDWWLTANRPFDRALAWALLAALLCLFVFMAGKKLSTRRFRPEDGFFLVFLACLAAYFFTPEEMSGGGFIYPRFAIFAVVALLFWITAVEDSRRQRKYFLAASAVFVIASVGGQLGWRRSVDRYLSEYDSGKSVVAPGSTMLSLRFSEIGDTNDPGMAWLRYSPFLHAAEGIALERRAVLLDNYEETADYFPLVFREGLSPYEDVPSWNDLETEPANVDLLAYGQKTGRPVEYVLVWGLRAGDAADDNPQLLFSQLGESYDLAFTSSPNGLLRIYRLKKFAR